jgi:hypothetical protein
MSMPGYFHFSNLFFIGNEAIMGFCLFWAACPS